MVMEKYFPITNILNRIFRKSDDDVVVVIVFMKNYHFFQVKAHKVTNIFHDLIFP